MPHERAVLVSVELDPRWRRAAHPWPLADEARELRELAGSTGSTVVGEVTARRHRPVAGTFLGEGKLQAIAQVAEDRQGQVVIFNQELSPAQQRNIEDRLRVKTIDRTQLILDIFAQRARSQEGKVQVELAQLRYLLPRLVGKGIMLSRLGGGIGTRGPGEQRLEMDRRRIRGRITRLSRDLEQLRRRRHATRSRRREGAWPVAALVGYTNAGKTTLLNRLTGAEGTACNQLFTTLDPLARRLRLVPAGEWIVLTDTVGFLHDLPHHLIEAFRATLEEARDADLLLHVLDASHPLAAEHADAVEDVLGALDLKAKPCLTVLNKRDAVADPARLAALQRLHAPAVAISAKTGQGLDDLVRAVRGQLDPLLVPPTRLSIPAARQDLVAAVYRGGQVLSRHDQGEQVELSVRLPAPLTEQFAEFKVSP
jgi:GTP-binding protein HflX